MKTFTHLLPILFFTLASIPAAHAYPEFIKNGYANCVTCHNSPRGGGMLNAYGKGIGASESFLARELPEEKKPTLEHGFLGRGMFLVNNEVSVFPMQLDYLGTLNLIDSLRFETVLGLQPTRVVNLLDNKKWSDYFVFRKILTNYRPAEGLEFSLGRDFAPVGIQLPDHTAYVKLRNRRNVTDFVTQLRAEYWGEKYQITPFLYLPSYLEAKTNQERGVGLRGEYLFNDTTSVGSSFLLGSTTSIDRQLYTLFARVSGEKFGVLSEFDLTNRKTASATFKQYSYFVKPFYFPFSWLEAAFYFEGLLVDKPFFDRLTRMGPSAFFRLNKEFSFQADGRLEFSRTGSTYASFYIQAIVGLL